MAIKIGEILIDIKADTAQLVTGMSSAQKQVEQTFAGMKRAASEFAQFVGVGLSLGGLVEFIKHGVEAQEQMIHMAAAAGVSVQQFSALAYVAKITGTPIESLAKGLQFLDKNMVAAASGNEKFVNLFRALGVDAFDPTTHKVRDAGVVFTELQAKLGAMSNQSEAAGIRMMLLGRGSGELAHMMGLSAESMKQLEEEAFAVGFVLGEKDREAAEAAAESFNRLRAIGEATSIQFAAGLAPALNEVATAFANAIGGAQGFRDLGQGLGSVIRFLGDLTLGFAYDVDLLFLKFQKLTLGATTNPEGVGEAFDASGAIKEIDDQEKALDARFRELHERLRIPVPPLSFAKPTGESPDLTKPAAAEDAHKLGNELDKLAEKTRKLLEREEGDKYSRLLGDINDQLQKIGRFESEHPERIWTNLNKQANQLKDAVGELQNKMFVGGLENLFPEEGTKEQPYARRLGDVSKLSDAVSKENLDSVIKTQIADPRAMEIFKETRTETERYAIELARLNEIAKAGSIDQDTFGRAVRNLHDNLLAGIDPLIAYQRREQEIGELQAAGANPLAVRAADLDNLEKFRHAWEEILIKQNTFGDSLHAALLHAADDAQQVGAKLYQAFTKAIEGLNQGITDLVFGDKTNFAQVIKGFGKDLFKAELEKNITGPLLGKLGGLFGGIPGLSAKADGSQANPFYVTLVGAGGLGGGLTGFMEGGRETGNGGAGGGLLGSIFGAIGGLFGGGGLSAGTNAFTQAVTALPVTMPVPLFASGGFLSEGELGIVGENGPEFARGGKGGTSIIPTSAMRGGHSFTSTVNINAPGATAEELKRYVDESSHRTMQQTIVAIHEQKMRRPD